MFPLLYPFPLGVSLFYYLLCLFTTKAGEKNTARLALTDQLCPAQTPLLLYLIFTFLLQEHTLDLAGSFRSTVEVAPSA